MSGLEVALQPLMLIEYRLCLPPGGTRMRVHRSAYQLRLCLWYSMRLTRLQACTKSIPQDGRLLGRMVAQPYRVGLPPVLSLQQGRGAVRIEVVSIGQDCLRLM